MADTVESIYQDFAAAMEAYSQAVTGIDNAMIELRAAEKKLQAVFDAYTQFIGQYNEDMASPLAGIPSLELFGRFTGSRSLNEPFDIGSLF